MEHTHRQAPLVVYNNTSPTLSTLSETDSMGYNHRHAPLVVYNNTSLNLFTL